MTVQDDKKNEKKSPLLKAWGLLVGVFILVGWVYSEIEPIKNTVNLTINNLLLKYGLSKPEVSINWVFTKSPQDVKCLNKASTLKIYERDANVINNICNQNIMNPENNGKIKDIKFIAITNLGSKIKLSGKSNKGEETDLVSTLESGKIALICWEYNEIKSSQDFPAEADKIKEIIVHYDNFEAILNVPLKPKSNSMLNLKLNNNCNLSYGYPEQ